MQATRAKTEEVETGHVKMLVGKQVNMYYQR